MDCSFSIYNQVIIGVPQDFTDFNIILKSWLYLTVKEKYEKESKLSGN